MTNNNLKIAFIGGGNMATAILSGLIQSGHIAHHIMVCSPSQSTRQRVTESFGVLVEQDNTKALTFADVIILAVKPNMVATVCQELRDAQENNSWQNVFMSVAAGISVEQLEQFSGNSRVIAAMPNLPSAIGQGVTGLYADKSLCDADVAKADAVMSAVGTTIWLDDQDDMPAIVAAAGSAPAYFYLFMEAMEKTALAQGLSKSQAYQAVVQTALGAVSLAKQSDTSFKELRHQVTSPKGTTEQGVNAFLNGGIEHLVKDAMQKVANRSRQLTEETS